MNRAIPSPLLPAVPRKEHKPKYDADLHLTLRDYFAQLRNQVNSQVQGFGAALASSAVITLTNANHHITGSNSIKTIKVPAGFSGPVFLVADGAWQLVTGGNIALAHGPMPVGQLIALTFDPSKNQWYPLGVGAGGGGGAPATATYATIANESAVLTNSRRLAAGTGITFADGGTGGTFTISNPGVTSISAGKDISVNASTGAVTVTTIMFHPFMLMGA